MIANGCQGVGLSTKDTKGREGEGARVTLAVMLPHRSRYSPPAILMLTATSSSSKQPSGGGSGLMRRLSRFCCMAVVDG